MTSRKGHPPQVDLEKVRYAVASNAATCAAAKGAINRKGQKAAARLKRSNHETH